MQKAGYLTTRLISSYFSGFDNFAEEVGISRDSSLKKEMSLDVEFDEKDRMKVGKISTKLFRHLKICYLIIVEFGNNAP